VTAGRSDREPVTETDLGEVAEGQQDLLQGPQGPGVRGPRAAPPMCPLAAARCRMDDAMLFICQPTPGAAHARKRTGHSTVQYVSYSPVPHSAAPQSMEPMTVLAA